MNAQNTGTMTAILSNMSARQSKMFVITFVASMALLATSGFAVIYEHEKNSPICECEGG